MDPYRKTNGTTDRNSSCMRNRKLDMTKEVIKSCININLHDTRSNYWKEIDESNIEEIKRFANMDEDAINKQKIKLNTNTLQTQSPINYLDTQQDKYHFQYNNALFQTMKRHPKVTIAWLVLWPIVDLNIVLFLLTLYTPFLIFLGHFGSHTDFLFHSIGIIGLLCSLIVQVLYWHHQILEMVVDYTKDSNELINQMKERLDRRFDWKTATHGSAKMVMDTLAKAILDQKQHNVEKLEKNLQVPKNEATNKNSQLNVSLLAKEPSKHNDGKASVIENEDLVNCSNITTFWLLLWPIADILLVLLLLVLITPCILFIKNLSEKVNFLLHSSVIVALFCSLIIQTLFWHHQMLEMAVDWNDQASKEMKDMNQRFKNRIYVKTATHT